jgi:hypothetical protein
MPIVVWGIVKEGKVIPETPLPEGMSVQITVPDDLEPDVREELDAWALGSAQALERVEELADEGTSDEKG